MNTMLRPVLCYCTLLRDSTSPVDCAPGIDPEVLFESASPLEDLVGTIPRTTNSRLTCMGLGGEGGRGSNNRKKEKGILRCAADVGI